MKELISKALAGQPNPQRKKLLLTEFLHHLILQSMYRHEMFNDLIFTGGTALRIVYFTGRFSEDLDFSLDHKKRIKISSAVEKIQNDLRNQQFDLEFHCKEDKTVARADLRFPGLLKQFDLSPLADQKLTVKFEVDRHPPAGGMKEVMLVSSPVSYMVTIYDLSSLFAAKLSAIFCRPYTKGRDYYDLVWFLGKRVKPNFRLLNNALRQMKGSGYRIQEGEFRKKLEEHLTEVDFGKVRRDVERFIIRPEELEFLALQPIKSLLRLY